MEAESYTKAEYGTYSVPQVIVLCASSFTSKPEAQAYLIGYADGETRQRKQSEFEKPKSDLEIFKALFIKSKTPYREVNYINEIVFIVYSHKFYFELAFDNEGNFLRTD